MTKKDYVYTELKNLILTEQFKEGDLLISESEICRRYDVSREPVRRALRRLIEKGYLYSKQGKGYIINPREFYLNTTIASLSVESKKTNRVKVLSFSKIPNDIDAAFDSEYLYGYTRIVTTDENVIYEEGFIPCTLFGDFDESVCEKSILEYFQEDKNLFLSHDKKRLKSVLVPEEHIINHYTKENVVHSIETTHNVYSGTSLIQISRQIKADSDITIVSTH